MKNEKYHIIGTIPKSKFKIVERDKIDTPNKEINARSISWPGLLSANQQSPIHESCCYQKPLNDVVKGETKSYLNTSGSLRHIPFCCVSQQQCQSPGIKQMLLCFYSICVLGFSILPQYTNLIFDFGQVPTVSYFLFFISIETWYPQQLA